MSEAATMTKRWESIRASRTIEIYNEGNASEAAYIVIRATVWSDRYGEWRSVRTSTRVDRVEKHDWVEQRMLEWLVRDLEQLDPR